MIYHSCTIKRRGVWYPILSLGEERRKRDKSGERDRESPHTLDTLHDGVAYTLVLDAPPGDVPALSLLPGSPVRVPPVYTGEVHRRRPETHTVDPTGRAHIHVSGDTLPRVEMDAEPAGVDDIGDDVPTAPDEVSVV